MLRCFFGLALPLTILLGSAGYARAASPTPAATGAQSPAAGIAPTPASTGVTSNANLPQFDKEAAAQQHCPKDEVVWLNLLNNYYFAKDNRFYNNTRKGVYVCRNEADAAGDHAARFGDPAMVHRNVL